MPSLDDVEALREMDKWGMLEAYLRWPEALLSGAKRAEELEMPREVRVRGGSIRYGQPSSVVIVGMGGSAAGGDLLVDLTWDRVPVPILVWRDYHLPAFVGPSTLVVAVSYSGNTEETLVAFSEALARRSMVVAITSGGMLGQLCRRLKLPLVEVPSGFKPRMALPYLFAPLPILMEEFGLVRGLREQVQAAAALMEQMATGLAPEVPVEQNQAKKLALELLGSVPVVYGHGFLRSVARRLKTQFNENSKVPSFFNQLPAMNHDEILGWEGEDEHTRRFSVLFLRDPGEELALRERVRITKALLADKVAKIVELWAVGASRLEKMFSTLYVGEVASLYLAFARGVDPYSTESIDTVKRELARLGLAEEARARAERLSPSRTGEEAIRP